MIGAVDEFDRLKLYFGYDYIVNPYIRIHQPTIGEIVEIGDIQYYSMVQTLCSIPSDRKSALWDQGIDYETISDFEYFRLLAINVPVSETRILFGDLDFTKFQLALNTINNEPILYNPKNNLVIDEFVYLKMIAYLRMLHGIKPKIEKAATQKTKQLLIQLDREKRLMEQKETPQSILYPLISSMLNHPGFKYTKNQLKEVGLYEFMDSVKRINKIQDVEALLIGRATNIDFTKFNNKQLDWLTDLND